MAQVYQMPTLDASVHTLGREASRGAVLGPETQVLVINRGTEPIRDKFDGWDYIIPPGKCLMAYGAAKHFQDRAIIRGTVASGRFGNLETRSYIGIIGLDEPIDCEPLDAGTLAKAAGAIEAFDRGAPEADQDVTVIGTAQQAAGRRTTPGPNFDGQATPGAQRAAQTVMTPPEMSDARLDAMDAKQAGGVPSTGRKIQDVAKAQRSKVQ